MTDEKKLRNEGQDRIEDEVEGQGMIRKATDQPQPDEDEVEGHGVNRLGRVGNQPEEHADDDDTEGHWVKHQG